MRIRALSFAVALVASATLCGIVQTAAGQTPTTQRQVNTYHRPKFETGPVKVFPEVHADRTVTFQISAPSASTVSLSLPELGRTQPMEKDSHGTWSVTVGPLLLTAQVNAQAPQLPPPSDMKVLGLIGGTSWYSTVDYYRYINKAVNDAYGNSTNPPLILYNMNQQKIHDLQAANDWDGVAALFSDAAIHLRAGGAQAIVFCANTPHKVYAQVVRKIDLPVLHIADATGIAIRQSGLKKVGLIGTLHTMEDGFIADWLKEHYGIESVVPSSSADQRELNRIIQQELSFGIFKPQSKKYVLEQIEELRKRGAQGIVLACTEFPLIIKPADVNMPVFDTTLLHSQMAVDFILGKPGLAHVRMVP